MRIQIAAVALVALTAAGCGGDESAPESDPSPTAETTEPTMTLAEACPEMEAALPSSGSTGAEWSAYADSLRDLEAEGDTETQNAVGILLPTVEELAADPEPGIEMLDAREALRGALDNLATRCKSAGSSAFQ